MLEKFRIQSCLKSLLLWVTKYILQGSRIIWRMKRRLSQDGIMCVNKSEEMNE